MVDDFSYTRPRDGAAPVAPGIPANLLVISDQFETEDMADIVPAAGLQLAGVVPLAQAADRLAAQIRCDAVLLFAPVATPLLEPLLDRLDAHVSQYAIPLIMVAGWDTIDLAFARLDHPQASLLCAPDRHELAAALVAAGETRTAQGRVHEKDKEGPRLQQLSEEVSRLARTLDMLTRHAGFSPSALDQGARMADRPGDYIGMPVLKPLGADTPGTGAVTAAQVRDLLRARRIRADFLPGDLFADPAWDMLLDLLAARLDNGRVSVSSLCIAAAVPPTTALRWIRTLTDKGLVQRQADSQDGRRVFIALAQEAADALIGWFAVSRRYLQA